MFLVSSALCIDMHLFTLPLGRTVCTMFLSVYLVRYAHILVPLFSLVHKTALVCLRKDKMMYTWFSEGLNYFRANNLFCTMYFGGPESIHYNIYAQV